MIITKEERDFAAAELQKLRTLILFDPMTGKEMAPEQLNDENRNLHRAAGIAIAVLNGKE